MRADLEVLGCCGRYRARMILRPGLDSIITVEGFGPSAAAAHAKVIAVAGALALPDFDPGSVEPRRWPTGQPRRA